MLTAHCGSTPDMIALEVVESFQDLPLHQLHSCIKAWTMQNMSMLNAGPLCHVIKKITAILSQLILYLAWATLSALASHTPVQPEILPPTIFPTKGCVRSLPVSSSKFSTTNKIMRGIAARQ